MLKKILSLVLVGVMALSLVACGESGGSSNASSDGGSQAVNKSNKNMKFNDEDFKDFFYYYVEDEVLHLTSEPIDGKTKMISCKQLDRNGLRGEYNRVVEGSYKSISFDNYVLLIDPIEMFYNDYANIENIDKLVVKGNAARIFEKYSGTTDFNKMNTSYITHMNQMFWESSVKNLNLNSWDMSNVESISDMFSECGELTTLNISNWNTSNIKYMPNVFQRCYNLKSLDLNKWDVSNVEEMGYMFSGCNNLSELKINKWNVQNVIKQDIWGSHGMGYMFENCESIKSLDLSSWKLNDENSIEYMFCHCENLENLKIGNWDNLVKKEFETSPYYSAFYGCKKSIVPEWYKSKNEYWEKENGFIN